MVRKPKEEHFEGDIFISYSRKDKKIADWLARQLQAGGFNIWIDRHDIPGGVEWSQSIIEAIVSAEAFVLLLSPNAVDSKEVIRELNTAVQNKIRILPVQIYPIDKQWLDTYNLNKLQNIMFYRRRQACVVDIINALGGLRGVAAMMPNKSTMAIRESAKFIVELLRIVQEVSFSSSHLIFRAGDENQYFIQFLGVRDSPEIYAEAVGNKYLEEKDQLDEQRVATLLELGWKKPNKRSQGNYWQEWQVHTNRDRATVAMITMTTFLKVYKHYEGEYISLEEIDLGN